MDDAVIFAVRSAREWALFFLPDPQSNNNSSQAGLSVILSRVQLSHTEYTVNESVMKVLPSSPPP